MAQFQQLPPGLRGLLAAEQMANQRNMTGLQMTSGLLGLQNQYMAQQEAEMLNPLKREQLRLAIADAQRQAHIDEAIMRARGVVGGGTQQQGNGYSPAVSQAFGIPQQSQPQGGAGRLPDDVALGLLSKRFAPLAKVEAEMYKPTDKMREAIALGLQPGTPAFNNFIGTQFTQQGAWQFDENGNIRPASGFAEGRGAITRAERGAESEFDIVEVPVPGGTQRMTRAEAIRRLNGQQPAPQAAPISSPASTATPVLSGRPQAEIDAIRQVMEASQQGRPASVSVSAPAPAPTPAPAGGMGRIPTANVVPGSVPPVGFKPSLPERTPGQVALDQAFAKEYADFKAAGGYSDIGKSLSQLRGASEALGSGESLTGPYLGSVPDWALPIINPRAQSVKEDVQEVAQRNLRLVLGAQFTEKEGERLIARVYNPRLPESENKKRVDRLMKQIDMAARVKQDAADYFEKHGTLTGWNGKLYTIDDFKNIDYSAPVSKPITNRGSRDVLRDADAILGIR